MIIVEGPDGGGKTTLIKKIQEAYPDLEVAPRVVSKDTEAMVDMQDWVNRNLAEGPQYKLFDRHRLISEFIYGPILRQQQHPGFNSPIWVHHSLRRFRELRPVVIYCIPPLEVVMANIVGDEDNQRVWDHIMGIHAAYIHKATIDNLTGNFYEGVYSMIYDYTTDGQESDPLGPLHLPINNMYGRTRNND